MGRNFDQKMPTQSPPCQIRSIEQWSIKIFDESLRGGGWIFCNIFTQLNNIKDDIYDNYPSLLLIQGWTLNKKMNRIFRRWINQFSLRVIFWGRCDFDEIEVQIILLDLSMKDPTFFVSWDTLFYNKHTSGLFHA